MARFDDEIDVAQEEIAIAGEQSIIQRRTDGVPPDPAKPWEPGAPTDVPHTVDAAWFDIDTSRIDGNIIKQGDQEVLVAAKGMTITPDPSVDRIERVDGTTWSIETVRTLSPNGQQIIHTLTVRAR